MGGQFPNGEFPFLENDGLCKQAKNSEKIFYLEKQNCLFRKFSKRKFDGLCKQTKNDENFPFSGEA